MHTCGDGSKRQLPPWMIQKVSASNVSNFTNVVETNCSTKDGDIITANVRKKETSRKKSNLNAKCEVKGRRNLGQENGSIDHVTQRKKRKGDRAPRSSVKKCKVLEDVRDGSSDTVSGVQASSDDDIELTVDDLMAIAEQYVKDYENKEGRETSRQGETKWQFPTTTETGNTLDSTCQNKKSSSSKREGLYSSAPTATSISQTDNPAQDMLDVFLGPLLRTTIEKEQKSKYSVDNILITHEFTRQRQNELVGEETIPLKKKRSTLKDQVAMLLG